MLNNLALAEHIRQTMGKHKDIFKVIVNHLSARVLVVFNPHGFAAGEIAKRLEKVIGSFDAAKASTKVNQAPSKKQTLHERCEANELYQLIKIAEGDNRLRNKAIALTSTYTFFKTLSPICVGFMISAVLFPAALPRMGMSTGMKLALFTGMFGASRLAESVTQHNKNQAWSQYANEVENSLVQESFEHVQSLQMGYLEDQNSEQLMGLINRDTATIQRFLRHTPDEITEKLTVLTLGSAAILAISPSAFLLSLLPIPFITKYNRAQKRATEDKYQRAAALEREFHQILSCNLNGLPTVKSFTAEDYEALRLSEAKSRVSDNAISIDKENSYYASVNESLYIVGVIAPLLYNCVQVMTGTMGIIPFMIVNGITPPLITAATGMEKSKSMYNDALQAAHRISQILRTDTEVNEHDTTTGFSDLRGEVKFNNISFAYQDKWVLRDICVDIPANGKIAFVGPTGSGKSTLMKLLLRFYELDQGNITIDGVDISETQLKDLRRSIAVVSQDPFLFSGTIYQNLIYGRPDATFEEVVEACKIAQAYEFIVAHPDGFHAQIGERGGKLSGGQRQRLSIARAVLKNASILILDEATSALDNETEAMIKESMKLVSKNRNVIIIAHRLSTIRDVDTIYHLKDSVITESGSHEQLLKLNGDYASLWRLQTAQQAFESDIPTDLDKSQLN